MCTKAVGLEFSTVLSQLPVALAPWLGLAQSLLRPEGSRRARTGSASRGWGQKRTFLPQKAPQDEPSQPRLFTQPCPWSYGVALQRHLGPLKGANCGGHTYKTTHAAERTTLKCGCRGLPALRYFAQTARLCRGVLLCPQWCCRLGTTRAPQRHNTALRGCRAGA